MQFLYQAPIGLVQAAPDGEITMMNPMSARLLSRCRATGTFEHLRCP